jgi:hypothetical protein
MCQSNALQLVLGFYSPYLKNVLEMFCFVYRHASHLTNMFVACQSSGGEMQT